MVESMTAVFEYMLYLFGIYVHLLWFIFLYFMIYYAGFNILINDVVIYWQWYIFSR